MRIFYLFFLLFIFSQTKAQLDRVEFEKEWEDDHRDLQFIPLKEEGVLVFHGTEKGPGLGEWTYSFKFLNAEFKETTEKELVLKKHIRLYDHALTDEKLVLLFVNDRDRSHEPHGIGRVHLLSFDLETKEELLIYKDLPVEVPNFGEHSFTGKLYFDAWGRKAYIMGSHPHRMSGETFLIKANLRTGSTEKLPAAHEDEEFLARGMRVHNNGNLGIVLHQAEGSQYRAVYREFDPSGEFVWQKEIKVDKGVLLHEAVPYRRNKNSLFIAGIYVNSERLKKMDHKLYDLEKGKFEKPYRTNYLDPEGVFLTLFLDKKQKWIKFRYFDQPSSYKINKAIFHGIYETWRGFFLMAELRRKDRMAPLEGSEQVISVSHFNEDGELVWRKDLKGKELGMYWRRMGSRKKKGAEIEPLITEDHVIISGNSGGLPSFVILKDGEISEVERFSAREWTKEDELIKESSELYTLPWYGDQFISWGHQVTENTDGEERELFFVDGIRMKKLK